jgi:hypothetical protein
LVIEPKYKIEHALAMHASSYIYLPAALLYDKDVVAKLRNRIGTFHVYIIGRMPHFALVGVRKKKIAK